MMKHDYDVVGTPMADHMKIRAKDDAMKEDICISYNIEDNSTFNKPEDLPWEDEEQMCSLVKRPRFLNYSHDLNDSCGDEIDLFAY